MPTLLRNELPSVLHLDHGWFGIRNRSPGETGVTDTDRDENEVTEFSKPVWESVPSHRKGIHALMRYVDKERRTKLHLQIPQIITEIRDKLRTCDTDLKRLGDPRNTPQAQRYYVLQFCNEMQRMTEAIFRGQYEDVRSEDPRVTLRYHVQVRLESFVREITDPENMELKLSDHLVDLEQFAKHSSDPKDWEMLARHTDGGIYAEIYREAKIREAQNLPGSVNPAVEEIIFRKMAKHWERASRRLMDDVKALVNDCNDVIARIAIPNDKTRFEARRMATKSLEEWDRDADNALRELLTDNNCRRLSTLNPWLSTRSKLAEQKRSEILLSMWDGASARAPASRHRVTSDEDNRSHGEAITDGEVENHEVPFLSTELSQVFHVAARVQTYYGIAVFRFADNIAMQVVERHLLGPKCPMRTISLERFGKLNDKELELLAGEDEADSLTRARLEREQLRYHKALAKWEELQIC